MGGYTVEISITLYHTKIQDDIVELALSLCCESWYKLYETETETTHIVTNHCLLVISFETIENCFLFIKQVKQLKQLFHCSTKDLAIECIYKNDFSTQKELTSCHLVYASTFYQKHYMLKEKVVMYHQWKRMKMGSMEERDLHVLVTK